MRGTFLVEANKKERALKLGGVIGTGVLRQKIDTPVYGFPNGRYVIDIASG